VRRGATCVARGMGVEPWGGDAPEARNRRKARCLRVLRGHAAGGPSAGRRESASAREVGWSRVKAPLARRGKGIIPTHPGFRTRGLRRIVSGHRRRRSRGRAEGAARRSQGGVVWHGGRGHAGATTAREDYAAPWRLFRCLMVFRSVPSRSLACTHSRTRGYVRTHAGSPLRSPLVDA
jgi:hypothetical protein